MEESMRTVLSNEIFENKKRKQNKKELFLITSILGIIIGILLVVALVLAIRSESITLPISLVAFLIVSWFIVMWTKSDGKSTFREVKDPTEEEILELAKKYLKDYEKSLENKPQELIEIELEAKEKIRKHKEGVIYIEEKIKELIIEIIGIPETD